MIARQKPPDARIERQIITGLIVSDRFIKEIKPIFTPDCLRVPFAQIVANWCMEYFDRYKTCPNKNIQDIFIERKKTDLEDSTASLIEDFLYSISNEYEEAETFNVDYILDKAEKHLRTVSLNNTVSEVRKALISGRLEEGEAIVKGYIRPKLETVRGVDPLKDKGVIVRAFDRRDEEELFFLPGRLGSIMGPFFRGQLFSFVGQAKVGKTWWLMLAALRAAFAGLNVIFVSLEMSEEQMIRRIHHWLNGLPTKKWAGEMLIPIFDCLNNQRGECNKTKGIKLLDEDGNFPPFEYVPRGYQPCTKCMGKRKFKVSSWYKMKNKKELELDQVLAKAKAIEETKILRGGRFHLVEFPSGSLSMDELKVYLYNLEEYEGFVPDVVVTDYADKFKSSGKYKDFRHSVHEVWEQHKGLAQEKKISVITASQSNTARTGAEIRQGSWAEDIRKLNLVDGAMALNMNGDQKTRGVLLAGIMAERHDYFDIMGTVTVLHQLKIGRPYLDSY